MQSKRVYNVADIWCIYCTFGSAPWSLCVHTSGVQQQSPGDYGCSFNVCSSFGTTIRASDSPAAHQESLRSAAGRCSSVTEHSRPSREGGALQSEKYRSRTNRRMCTCWWTTDRETDKASLLFSTTEVFDAVLESAYLMLQVKLDLPLGRFLYISRQMLPGKRRTLARFLKGACCSSSGSVVSKSLLPFVYLQNGSGDSGGSAYLQSMRRLCSSVEQ